MEENEDERMQQNERVIINVLLPSHRDLPIHVGEETHSHPTKPKQNNLFRERLKQLIVSNLEYSEYKRHSLFLQARHRTNIVGLKVVDDRPQTLDPLLQTHKQTK